MEPLLSGHPTIGNLTTLSLIASRPLPKLRSQKNTAKQYGANSKSWFIKE